MDSHQIKLATIKAGTVTALFLVAGIVSYIWQGGIHPALAIFYIILCVNTYFSVRLFASIIPMTDIRQDIIDVVLFVLYLALAWYLPDAGRALTVAIALFIVATVKYAQMIEHVPYRHLLARKLTVEAFGTLALFICYLGVLFADSDTFLWSWAGIFFFANVYLIFVRPLYTLRRQ